MTDYDRAACSPYGNSRGRSNGYGCDDYPCDRYASGYYGTSPEYEAGRKVGTGIAILVAATVLYKMIGRLGR